MRPPVQFEIKRARGRVCRPGYWQDGTARQMLQAYDWKGALDSCREVLRHDPDHLGALETMAQAQWLGGEFANVVATTTRLLHLNPHEPGYRYTRGMARMSLGELARAADDFRYAIGQSKDPRFQAQVESSLQALEIWMDDPGSRRQVSAFAGNRLGTQHGHGCSSFRVH